MRGRGLKAAAFERGDDPGEYDILTRRGFVRAVRTILETKKGSLDMFGVVYSRWVFINRAMPLAYCVAFPGSSARVCLARRHV
eukprot:15450317-Alexandrium_andersonii.AAC.1